MEYKGKLYGHLGDKRYFDTGKTADDWDNLEKRIAELEAENKALSMSGVSDSVRCYIEKSQKEAWDKMGNTGNDEYQETLSQENYWFGYYRALEDFESEFLESTDR